MKISLRASHLGSHGPAVLSGETGGGQSKGTDAPAFYRSGSYPCEAEAGITARIINVCKIGCLDALNGTKGTRVGREGEREGGREGGRPDLIFYLPCSLPKSQGTSLTQC